MRQLLVLASGNAHKCAELRAMLDPTLWDVRPADELGLAVPSILEDGDTFEANAIKKAEGIAAVTHTLTLADDSGLEVDALNGAPGVRSARFAHERATDAENNAALIEALRPVLLAERYEGPTTPGAQPLVLTARFRCVLCLVDPFALREQDRRIVVDGVCEGEIITVPRGAQGFGYDPLFVVRGGTMTFAELSDADKRAVSHRGRAMQAMRQVLEARLVERRAQLGLLGSTEQ